MWPFKKQENRSINLEDLIAIFNPRDSRSGSIVTQDTAQGLTSVFSAINFISKQVSSYPLKSNNQYVNQLLDHSPDGIITANQWKLSTVLNLLISGNGYSRIKWNQAGQPVKIEFLTSNRVTPVIEQYQLKGYWVDGKAEPIRNIIHFKVNSVDSLTGRSPIAVCRDAIGLGISQQNQAADQQANGMKPSGVIEYPDFLSSEKGKKFKSSLNERKQGETLVLEGGAKWSQVSMSNADAEFIESRKFTVDEVARIFNLDKIWLQNSGTGAKYDEVNASQKSLLINTIQPYLIAIESELQLKLLDEVKFNLAEIQRLDAKTRYEVYKTAKELEVFSTEEIQKREGITNGS